MEIAQISWMDSCVTVIRHTRAHSAHRRSIFAKVWHALTLENVSSLMMDMYADVSQITMVSQLNSLWEVVYHYHDVYFRHCLVMIGLESHTRGVLVLKIGGVYFLGCISLANRSQSWTTFCPCPFRKITSSVMSRPLITCSISGPDCEYTHDSCVSNPCPEQSSHFCEDLVQGYKCHCKLGWGGVNCEINEQNCASNPCVTGTHSMSVLCQGPTTLDSTASKLHFYICACI